MKFSIKVELLISLLIVGVIYGFSYHLIVMPLIHNQIVHCVLMGSIYAGINYLVTIRIYKKYISVRETNKILNSHVRTDRLTGLLNRRAFDKDINEISSEKTYSLIFMDIDNFRNFNNKFGHQVGDTVLQKVSGAVRHSIRACDKAYRYGGEEVVILLNDCSKKNALNLAEKIRQSISSMDNSPFPSITVSLGVSNYPEDGVDVYQIIKTCDEAMLNAKRQGKNRTCAC